MSVFAFLIPGWTTHDDRDKVVPLYALHARLGKADPTSGLDDEELRRLCISARYTRFPGYKSVLLWLAILIAIPAITIYPWFTRAHLSNRILFIVAGTVAFVFALASHPFFRGSSKRFRTAMLRYWRCPSCAYKLDRDIPRQPDACTICPECAAAWKLPPKPPSRRLGVRRPIRTRPSA